MLQSSLRMTHTQKWVLFKLVLIFVYSVLSMTYTEVVANTNINKKEIMLESPAAEVILVVTGAIERKNKGDEAHFDSSMLQGLPVHTTHTTTLVTDGVKRFDGVLVRDLFDMLGVSKAATSIQARALNDYVVTIPVADFYNYDVLLATHMDGVKLQPTDKGPLWLVYPRDSQRLLQDIRYDYRWVWQLNHLTIR